MYLRRQAPVYKTSYLFMFSFALFLSISISFTFYVTCSFLDFFYRFQSKPMLCHIIHTPLKIADELTWIAITWLMKWNPARKVDSFIAYWPIANEIKASEFPCENNAIENVLLSQHSQFFFLHKILFGSVPFHSITLINSTEFSGLSEKSF